MIYPANMSPEEIMEFEYEYNRLRDIEEGTGQLWAVNAEIQVVVNEQLAQHQQFVFVE